MSMPLTKQQAMNWLAAHSPMKLSSYRQLADTWKWDKTATWKVIDGWRKKGWVETERGDDGLLVHAVAGAVPVPGGHEIPGGAPGIPAGIPAAPQNVIPIRESVSIPAGNPTERWVSSHSDRSDSDPESFDVTPPGTPPEYMGTTGNPEMGMQQPSAPPAGGLFTRLPAAPAGVDTGNTWKYASGNEKALILIAFALSGVAAVISVAGLRTLFPAEPTLISVLGWTAEAAKFVGTATLSAGWRRYGWLSRMVLAVLILNVAVLNAISVYGKLVDAHTVESAARTADFEESDGEIAARIEDTTSKIRDLSIRIGTLDRVPNLDRWQRKEHDDLDDERAALRKQLASDKAKRAGGSARHRQDEARNVPAKAAVRMLIDLHVLAPDTDPDAIIRFVALSVLAAADPLALCILWTLSSRRRRRDRGGYFRLL